MMKYFFQAILLGYFAAALANSNLPSKPPTGDSQCTVKNNYFIAGSNSKKIENMISEIKQELAEIKQEIRGMKGNKTGGPGEKGL